MLRELFIKDFALIRDLKLEFGDGLNVLTGETGAGKSIVIDALGLFLGTRASSDFVRAGAKRAVVEGVFESEDEELREILTANGFEEDFLILTRIIAREGKSICRINNRVVTLQFLEEIGRRLLTIYGQSQDQSLLLSSRHLEWLDQFVGEEALLLRRQINESYRRKSKLEKELEELTSNAAQRRRELDFLKYQAEEIERANLRIGEEEELLAEEKKLAHAEKLTEAINKAYRNLFSSEGEKGAYDLLAQAADLLKEALAIDSSLFEWQQEIQNLAQGVQEIALTLKKYSENIEYNPQNLEIIQARLFELKRLMQKYGNSTAEILDYHSKIEQHLKEIEGSSFKTEELEKAIKIEEENLKELSLKLTSLRREGALKLEAKVEEELKDLLMPSTRFVVELKSLPQVSATGAESAEFYFTPNPGEPLKPLIKTASGGELSRVMLAIKNALNEKDVVPTLIFDEVDSGLGGKAAQAIAEKLFKISRLNQVISVTHSPQVASFADRHFEIEKEVKDGSTFTKVYLLERLERVEELARMLAGSDTKLAKEHARELLDKAEQKKEKEIIAG